MAKRKRLTPARPEFFDGDARAPETKSALGPVPPIAQVAGEAAALSALKDVTDAMREARDEGRLVQKLPLKEIAAGHLVRDRVGADREELDALIASIRAHGQRTPIEVVTLPEGGFGLISGWRRLVALEHIYEETGDERFATALALLRHPADAPEAYVAMVEENEVRANLSFYERARIVVLSVREGVFPTEKVALRSLFATTSRAKRSKIGSFLQIVHALDGALRFPAALSERQGLALAKAITAGQGLAIRARLDEVRPGTAEAEQAVLQMALKPTPVKPGPAAAPSKPGRAGVAPRVVLTEEGAAATPRLVLSGPGVDAAFRARLAAWLKTL